jgi:hypothetical protein
VNLICGQSLSGKEAVKGSLGGFSIQADHLAHKRGGP